MKTTRYATSRQKACQQCSNAKAKCDRQLGRCGRCTQRNLSCAYPQTVSSGNLVESNALIDPGEPYSPFSASAGPLSIPETELHASRHVDVPTVEPTQSVINGDLLHIPPMTTPGTNRRKGERENVAVRASMEFNTLDFAALDLVCPISVDEISNRWLNAYIPVPGKPIKEYSTRVTAFICRILKSYVAVVIRGCGIPPFVHPAELTVLSAGSPLSACLSLVRICEKPMLGAESIAASVLQREMDTIYESRKSYEDMALLAAYQSYLMYSMVLFFQLGQTSNPFLRQAMINLQELACSSSSGGLVCMAEQKRARPRWEEWIVAEAKRRTLFTMYLFDSMLSAQDNLPTFLGTELQGLLAPSNKFLWQAQARYDWETAYNIHLAEWLEGGLSIDELWAAPANLTDRELDKRCSRVDQWLESIDEFGTMLYAVTSYTHGG